MVDTVGELVQGMRDMRVREALLVTALMRLGEPMKLTQADATKAAEHAVHMQHTDDGLIVSLKPVRRMKR